MASIRSWRQPASLTGPYRVALDEIAQLNTVFSDAFTERYRRDGMVGVRVPHLNPQVWRYAIEDADDGALVWRDARGDIAAFNMIHRSGTEGWMGPLALRTDHQGRGVGGDVVRYGIDWLRARHASVIGLETMPRTLDNIGFYSVLGFDPGRLTLTVTLDAESHGAPAALLSHLSSRDRCDQLDAARALLQSMRAGYDYTREIELTESLALGETVLVNARDTLAGFALCHTAALVEGRSREELRVLKLVLRDDADVPSLVEGLRDLARRSGTRRVAIRVQGEYTPLYRQLIAMGGRVRWSDLRMSLASHPEPAPSGGGVVLSNWEI